MHDYVPDFIIRLKSEPASYVVLETKGYDLLEEIKSAAADRWAKAVNADGSYGTWRYVVAKKLSDIPSILDDVVESDSPT
jgi:type III restriction enzyme